MTYELNITPNTKPRMTRRDKWLNPPRSCVKQYWEFKDKLKAECKRVGFVTFEAEIKRLEFHIPMPDSWSKKKKQLMDGKPHQQSPDLDNCTKAGFDSLLDQDNYIYKVENLAKYWSYEGKIIIEQ